MLKAIFELLRALLGRSPSASPDDTRPLWLRYAEREVGFHETGVNHGIERYLVHAKTGNDGDPWCAIFANAMLEKRGIHGTRSAMARSFEHDEHFVRLPQPALGAIVTMWRGSRESGQGHVFFYTGTDQRGNVWGIGGNEDDGVRKVPHNPLRITGYWWPKSISLPTVGVVRVDSVGDISTKEV